MENSNTINTFKLFFGTFLNQMEDMQTIKHERKEELKIRWKLSKNLPRKKKKAERKDILLTWSILNWEPIEGFDESIELFKRLLK